MVLGYMLQTHRDKLNNYTNYDTFRCMNKAGTSEFHRSMTSYFNVINKPLHKATNKGSIYSYKHTEVFNNPYKKK